MPLCLLWQAVLIRVWVPPMRSMIYPILVGERVCCVWERAAASLGEPAEHEPVLLRYVCAVLPKARRLKVLKTQFTSRAPD